jgi:hypothetical protein
VDGCKKLSIGSRLKVKVHAEARCADKLSRLPNNSVTGMYFIADRLKRWGRR